MALVGRDLSRFVQALLGVVCEIKVVPPERGGHSKLCHSRPTWTGKYEMTPMMVRCSLSLEIHCHDMTMVLGSFPTLRWGAKIWCWAPDLA
jgi:hypothetical protein